MNSDESPQVPRSAPAKHGFLARMTAVLFFWNRKRPDNEDALKLPAMTRGMQTFSLLAFFILGSVITWFVVANPFGLGFLPQPPASTAPAAAGGSSGDSAATGVVYQCPMHPEVVQDHPADCPICGMTLVEVKEAQTGESKGAAGKSGERKVLYWYAPMDATYIRNEPGVSPMGMKLVPKYADENSGSEEGVIRIDPVQVQNTGVVSTRAETTDIARYSRTVGILDYNAENITWINTKFEGWIEKVHVNYVGEAVTKGQPLFEIYGPELVTTQEEYLRALEYRASLEGGDRPGTQRQAENLVQATRDRLGYWDITDEQIERLETSKQVLRRLTITSPVDGVVAKVMSEALEGMFVKPGMDLYRIADLSTIWVHAEIYEMDMAWIRAGQPAAVSFRNSPTEQFQGKVLFLYPEVSQDTRTLKICVEVLNPQRRLRPGMYADVTIHGPPVTNAVSVPQSAVLRTGERNIIFVDLGEGRFEPREVNLGVKGEGDRIQITNGITVGERVVTQGQFMLDSESRIQAAIAQFRERSDTKDQAETQPAQAEHVH